MERPEATTVLRALELFNAVRDSHCWGVRAQTGVLHLDFGLPFLRIREPRGAPPDTTAAATRISQRRLVIPTGRWHLFVEDGNWRVTTMGLTCARTDTDVANQPQCLGLLNGQKLTGVAWNRTDANWEFTFDLGALMTIAAPRLSTQGPTSDQWTLLCEGQYSLTCRRDDDLMLHTETPVLV